MISVWKEGAGWNHIPGTELIYRDGSKDFLGLHRRIYESNFITPIVRAIGLLLMLIAWSIAIVSIGLLSWLRKDPIVQRAQPFFMLLLCTGSIIVSTSIFTLAWDEDAEWSQPQLSIACSLTPWFFFTGHILIFCSLSIKLWRVDRVLQSRHAAVSFDSAQWLLAAFLVATFLILAAHSVYDPWSWKRSIINEIPAETYGMCESNHAWAFFGPLIGLLFLAEAMTLYYAWKTVDVPEDFRDSTAVMYACMAQIQAWAVGVPMLALIGYSSADATYLARTLLVWIFSVSGVLVIVGPKIVRAIRIRCNPHFKRKRHRVSVSGVFHSGGSSHMNLDEASQPMYRHQDYSSSGVHEASRSKYGYPGHPTSGLYGNSHAMSLREELKVTTVRAESGINPLALKQIQEEDISSDLEEKDEGVFDPYTDYIHGERTVI